MCLNFRCSIVKLFFVSVFSILYLHQSYSQQIVKYPELDNLFYDYDIMNIDAESIYLSVKSSARNNAVRLNINETASWNLILENSGIISSQYSLVESNEDGLIERKGTKALPMSGTVEGVTGSQVSLTFNSDFIYGFIKMGQSTYFIEPLYHFVKSGQKNKFVMYSINDIKPGEEKVCGYDQYIKEKQKVELNQPQTGSNRMPGGCFIVDYAIASDFSMVSFYGNVAGVENHNIGVLNNVQTNYDNDFADEIQFLIVQQWVSNCSTCDPWSSSTNAGTLLDSFTAWGPSGFSAVHDVASIWTRRDFNGGTIGIAWLNAVCTGNRYNALQDFSSNAQLKRCLASHEIGHNFSATHNTDIMAPSVSTSNTWSSTSISQIQNFYLSANCLSACSSGVAPTAGFTYTTSPTCAPVSVQFTDQSVGATSRVWSFPGGTPSTSTAASPTVTYPATGQYQVTLVATNNFGSNNITMPVNVTALPLPTPNFNFSVNENTVQFTYTGSTVTSYSWNFGDGSPLSNLSNPIHTYAQNGVYNVTLQVTNTCGTNSISYQVVISLLPRANFIANQTFGCQPLTVNFTNLSDYATSYQWTFQGGTPETSNQTNPTVIYNAPGMFTVVLEAFNDAGSVVETKVDYINIQPLPTADFIVNISGATASFIFEGSFQNTVSWNFGDGATVNGVLNPVHTYAVNGTYNVTLTVSNTCGSQQITYPITISFLPSADFLANATSGCEPLTVNFSNFSTNAVSYLWTFEGGVPATSTAVSPVVVYNQPGLHNVSLEAFNSAGNVIQVKSNYINVMPEPMSSFMFDQNNATFTFINESQFFNSISWDFGDGTQSTDTNPTYTYQENGVYNVTLSVSNACGFSSYTQEINVALPPTATFQPSTSTTICAGESIAFESTSSFGPVSYLWNFEGGTPSTSTDPNPTVAFQNGGIFDVTLIVSNGNGSSEIFSDDLVVVNQKPQISFQAAVDGFNVQFTQNILNGTNASWNFGDNQTSSSSNPSHTYSQQGTYTVTLSDSNGCGTTTYTKDILIQLIPTAGFTSSANIICPASSVQFTSQSSSSVTAWEWIFEGGTPATSTLRNPLVKYDQPGDYNVTLVVTNQAGQGSVMIDEYVKVLHFPEASFSFVIDSNRVSLVNTGIAGNEWIWTIFNNESSNQLNGQNETFSVPENGNYFIYLTTKNQCGQDVSDTLELSINIYPEARFKIVNEALCTGNEVFFNSESLNASNHQWYFDGGSPEISGETNPKVIYNQSGTYEVALIVNNSLGSDTIISTIQINAGPTSSFEFETQLNGLVQFNYTGENESSVVWNFGDENTSTEKNPKHTYTKSGLYTVTLIVENSCGKDTFSTEVNILLSSLDDERLLSSKVIVTPNPGNGVFQIKAVSFVEGKYNLTLTDVLGRTLFKKSIVISKEEFVDIIDFAYLNEGLYFMTLGNGKKSVINKVVISR